MQTLLSHYLWHRVERHNQMPDAAQAWLWLCAGPDKAVLLRPRINLNLSE